MLRILIAGGSYGMYSHEGTWIDHLRKLTNSEIENVSQPGGSNYIILENLKKVYKEDYYDYVIILPVSYTRIPIVNDYPDLCSWLPDDAHFPYFWKAMWNSYHGKKVDGKKPLREYQKAARGYFKYFYNDNFLIWLTKQIINDITHSVSSTQKIIWIDTGLLYSHESLFNEINSGIKVGGTLVDVSDMEQKIVTQSNFKKTGSFIDYRRNHLCDPNNEILGKFISQIILTPSEELKNSNFDLRNVQWNTDPEILSSTMLEQKYFY